MSHDQPTDETQTTLADAPKQAATTDQLPDEDHPPLRSESVEPTREEAERSLQKRPQTAAEKAQQAVQRGPLGRAMEILRAEANRMRRLIPDGTLDQKRAYRQIERALLNNPKLAIAAAENPGAFIEAVEEWMMSGLPLHRDYASLIPYGTETTFVRGYRGLEVLGYRSGRVSHFKAEAICANDTFEYDDGIEPYLHFRRCLTDRGPVIGAWALAKLTDGNTVFRVVGIDRIDRAKKSSHSKAWKTDEAEMSAKTAILALSKFLPMCPDLQVAASIEEARMVGERPKFQPYQEATVIDAEDDDASQ